MSGDLRALRVKHNIPAREMVAVVQQMYPKYDKTVQSKCENGEAYGITLRPDAMKALRREFDPDGLAAQERRKKDRHKMTCRITVRFTDAEYKALQQLIKANGKVTMQDVVRSAVQLYFSLNQKG